MESLLNSSAEETDAMRLKMLNSVEPKNSDLNYY